VTLLPIVDRAYDVSWRGVGVMLPASAPEAEEIHASTLPAAVLRAGANDLGGTLMNETISRAAGAAHGQEMSPEGMETLIRSIGRQPVMRTTTYEPAAPERRAAAFGAGPLSDVANTPLRRKGEAGEGRYAQRK
ncbi:MAG: hypothetical protein RLO48_15655, partial [Bauldia litoralis]